MSTDVIDSLMRRLDRIEAMVGSFRDPIDHSSELKALRAELATLKTDLAAKPSREDIKAIKAELATMHPTVQTHKDINAGLLAATEVIIDDMSKTEKELRTAISDSTRVLQRDIERAESAAAASIKHAGNILAAYAADLGA